jgi:hypothetical protein
MTADSTPGPGVDVMITIFCYFCQFSAEKNGVFSQKPMLWSHFWNQTSCSLRKNAIFFGENIFKIVTPTQILTKMCFLLPTYRLDAHMREDMGQPDMASVICCELHPNHYVCM